MNIFCVNTNPQEAARQLCDKHVVKMPLESAQMLCTVLHGLDISGVPYKKCHQKHPCTLWAGASQANFNWLLAHGLELCAEYTRRYKKIHASEAVLRWCAEQDISKLPDLPLSVHPQAMPDDVKRADPVEAYQTYYKVHKAYMAKWKNTTPPTWWAA